jgi:transcriptional regulator with XRE-family HTH domain
MKREILERFGMRVRQVRQERGMSQEALAFASGLDRSYVGSVERGTRNISLLNVEKIAKALEIEASGLL